MMAMYRPAAANLNILKRCGAAVQVACLGCIWLLSATMEGQVASEAGAPKVLGALRELSAEQAHMKQPEPKKVA